MKLSLIFLIVLYPGSPGSDFVTDASKSLDAFLSLLNLTDLTCESIQWCTIQRDPDPYTYRPCCPFCSCEKQCFEDGNCCPDIKLSQHLNGTVFTNISQLVTTIKEIDSVNEIDIAYRNGVRPESQVGLRCLPSALFENFIYSTKAPMYFMTATCQNRSVSAEAIDKCENKRGLNAELKLEDIRPVQVRKSGAVYRNMHCFDCSNETDIIPEMWDVYLADDNTAIKRIHVFDPPYPDILSYVLQGQDSHRLTNIFFAPTSELHQSHPPLVCVSVDVETCEEALYDSHDSTKDACQLFVLPIYSRYDSYNVSFQNLACVHCNGIDSETRKGICSGILHRPTPPFLWKLRNELLQDIEPNNVSPPEYGETTINTFLSSKCKNGFVYDSAQKLCRQIHCPCGMMAHNTTCVPTFTAIPGMYYEIFFSVIAKSRLGSERADLQYDDAIMKFFQLHFDTKEDIGVADIALWKSDNKGTYRDDVVHVLLAVQPKSIDYNYLLKPISKLTKESKTVSIDKNVLVDISVVDIVRVSTSQMIVAPKRQKNYRLANATTWVFIDMPAHNIIEINTCQFCYLVELLNGEFEIKYGRTYYLPRTKTFGAVRSLSFIRGISGIPNRPAVCVSDVIEQVQESKVGDPLDNGCCSSLQEDTTNDIQRSSHSATDRNDIIIGVSLVAIVLFILLIAARTKARRTETPSPVNTNNADALEMSNVIQE